MRPWGETSLSTSDKKDHGDRPNAHNAIISLCKPFLVRGGGTLALPPFGGGILSVVRSKTVSVWIIEDLFGLRCSPPAVRGACGQDDTRRSTHDRWIAQQTQPLRAATHHSTRGRQEAFDNPEDAPRTLHILLDDDGTACRSHRSRPWRVKTASAPNQGRKVVEPMRFSEPSMGTQRSAFLSSNQGFDASLA